MKRLLQHLHILAARFYLLQSVSRAAMLERARQFERGSKFVAAIALHAQKAQFLIRLVSCALMICLELTYLSLTNQCGHYSHTFWGCWYKLATMMDRKWVEWVDQGLWAWGVVGYGMESFATTLTCVLSLIHPLCFTQTFASIMTGPHLSIIIGFHTQVEESN